MDKALKALFCLSLAVSYVLACAGFGVHTCQDDGSRHLVSMLGQVSCESIHGHSHGEDHDHHHDDGCCSTQLYVITDAQDCSTGNNIHSAPTCLPLHFISGRVVSVFVPETPVFAPRQFAPPLKLLPSQSFLSVWRA